MKICAISDLHGYLPELPKCDVVCICGDISPLKIQRYTKDMKEWMINDFFVWCRSLKCEHIIFIAGNHDWLFERHPEYGNTINEIQDKIIYLEDSSVTIEGKVFYGTPWCPDLKNWAFYGDHLNLVEKFSEIPENVDVLLSHCPPKVNGYGIVLQQDVHNWGSDYGCYELTDAIIEKKPKYLFCGHVHSGEHTPNKHFNTIIANVSIKDEKYGVNYESLIIDI